MAKIWCAALECVNNKNNRCTAAEINLTEGHIHTVYEGFKRVWGCRTYNMSGESKQLQEKIMEFLSPEAKTINVKIPGKIVAHDYSGNEIDFDYSAEG